MAYCFLTRDALKGNYRDLRAPGKLPTSQSVKGSFVVAAQEPHVWMLLVIYGACFRMELTLINVLALYFIEYFEFF